MRDSYLLISYCQIEAWYFISLSSRHNGDQWGLESLPAVYPNCYKLFFVWLSKFNNWMECSNIIVDSRYLDICLIEVMVDTRQLRNRTAGLHHSPVVRALHIVHLCLCTTVVQSESCPTHTESPVLKRQLERKERNEQHARGGGFYCLLDVCLAYI